MCGIIGYVGERGAAPLLSSGLKKLEYRGYDSAGFALIDNNELAVIKDVGRIDPITNLKEFQALKGSTGIAHCRWATNGGVTKENAHPHVCGEDSLALVHNGIIENYAELRSMLQKEGIVFKSETDTEVIVHLIQKNNNEGIFKAVQETVKTLEGAYSIVVIDKKDQNKMIAARKESPLVIGCGDNENFVASDVPAILNHTKRFIFLEEGDIAEISKDKITIVNEGKVVSRKIEEIDWDAEQAEKQGYTHFMLKEIHEQVQAIANTINERAETTIHLEAELAQFPKPLSSFSRVVLLACGTSWHAALIGKYMFEELAKIPTEVDYASEYRYRKPIIDESVLVISISQSGETADTLAALREAKKHNALSIGIVNAIGSTIARESHAVLYTHAGPEIGVASTKAFTSQLAMLYVLALELAIKREKITESKVKEAISELRKIPLKVETCLKREEEVKKLAEEFHTRTNVLYLGRGPNFPIALEGALKLKEVSYIHAEGYPAAEMKHGPIALIDENMPVIFIATKDQSYKKVLSNIEEVKARGGHVIAIATDGDEYIKAKADHVLFVPQTDDLLLPLLTVIPLQLLAYYVAIKRKCDVDKPRNLAKSVTVE